MEPPETEAILNNLKTIMKTGQKTDNAVRHVSVVSKNIFIFFAFPSGKSSMTTHSKKPLPKFIQL